MRIRSEGEIARFDLAALRPFVPALWAEWDALRFDPGGRLLDPDSGESLTVLQLSDSLHRTAGARYSLSVNGSALVSFTLAEDDGRTVRGTVAGPSGSANVAIGDRMSASGHGAVKARDPLSPAGDPFADTQWTVDMTIGDRWRADGRVDLVGRDWTGGLTLGERWHALARIDVRKLLLANEVPGYAVTLVGGREATVDLDIDPAVINRRGDLVTGRARMQRAAADGVVNVSAKSDVWRCRITLHLHGRGVLGRSALLAARPVVKRAARDGFAEFWADLVAQATSFENTLAELERDTTAAGGPDKRLHRELWEGVREADRASRATAAAASRVAERESDRVVSVGRRRRRRHGYAVPAAIVAFLAVIIVVVVFAVVGADSSGGSGSADPDLTSTPTLGIRQVTIAAFAGTDLQGRAATAAIVGGLRVVPEIATDDLTRRGAGTIWNTATIAKAPDGTVYDVFVLAVDLKSDPHHANSPPSFADTQALGATTGLGAGWRSTTELGPLSGPPAYPSATNLTGHTLLIIRLNVAPGTAAELRRLTAQLPLLVRQRYIAATRP